MRFLASIVSFHSQLTADNIAIPTAKFPTANDIMPVQIADFAICTGIMSSIRAKSIGFFFFSDP